MIKSAIEELTGYKEIHVNDRDDIILDDKWKISGSAARLLRTVIPRNNSMEHSFMVWVLWKLSERINIPIGSLAACQALDQNKAGQLIRTIFISVRSEHVICVEDISSEFSQKKTVPTVPKQFRQYPNVKQFQVGTGTERPFQNCINSSGTVFQYLYDPPCRQGYKSIYCLAIYGQ